MPFAQTGLGNAGSLLVAVRRRMASFEPLAQALRTLRVFLSLSLENA